MNTDKSIIRFNTDRPYIASGTINESTRRSRDFFGDSKHGIAIHKLLKGKWNSSLVEKFLDKLGDDSDIRYIRIIDNIAKNIGLNARQYKNANEQLPAMLKQMEILYKEFLTETVTEAKKYDIGMARKGNGVTVYNRSDEEFGDYKTVAHISDKGIVKYYDKSLPNNIKKMIDKHASKMKDRIIDESINEVTLRKGLKLRMYLNGNSYIVDYELVKPNYYNAIKGGKTNLFKVIDTTHPKIKVGSTEDFSTNDIKAQLKSDIMSVLTESVKNGKSYKEFLTETVTEAKKTFKVNPPIGKAKYSISFHDGKKTNRDGSPFSDLRIFKSKVELETAVKDFKSKGFIEESKETIYMNNLDWGKSTAERNANLDKYNLLKTDKEKNDFLRKLKGESVNETVTVKTKDGKLHHYPKHKKADVISFLTKKGMNLVKNSTELKTNTDFCIGENFNESIPPTKVKSKLSDEEVNKLYRQYPKLDDPYYPSKVIKRSGNSSTIQLSVGGKSYMVDIDSKGDDTWYLLENHKSYEGINTTANEAYTGNAGDKLVHKYYPEYEIELIEPTKKGWKVYQTKNGKNKKIAFFSNIDITGPRALFETTVADKVESLSPDIAKHMSHISTGFKKVEDDGVMVYDSPSNAKKASDFLNSKKIATSSDGRYVYIESKRLVHPVIMQQREKHAKNNKLAKVKSGSIVIPYAHDAYGEFIIDRVFKNKDGETSYTGRFKKNGERREFILHSKDRIIDESVSEYDKWKNTRIQAKNIFRMLKQKYNNDVSKMRVGLEDVFKQNGTKNDQAEVVRDEFKKYFKLKESINERKQYNTLADFEKDAKIGQKFYLGKYIMNSDYFRVVGKKSDGTLIVTRSGGRRKYIIGADRYDELVTLERKSVNESKYNKDLDRIEAVVKSASSFMNVGAELKKAGIKYDFSTSMIPMYRIKVPGNTIAIVNKKYAAGAEREVGELAIGLMEGIVSEGNAFGMAVTKAKQEGKKEFEFNGKIYKVKKGSYEKNESAKDALTEIIKNYSPGDGEKIAKIYSDHLSGEDRLSHALTVVDVLHANKLVTKSVAQKLEQELANSLAKLRKSKNESMNNTLIDESIQYSSNGYVKKITNLAGKFVKEITLNGILYRYNSTYKTYNSVNGNKLLHKSDILNESTKSLRKFKKGDRVRTREGNIETVIRVNSNGNVETKENDYSWPSYTLKLAESLKENSDSLFHYVMNFLPSGTIANHIDASDYKTIDKVRSYMIQILKKKDLKYSITNLYKVMELAAKAAKVPLMKENKIDWKELYRMAKDTSGWNPEFIKKYGSVLDRPHIEDALTRSKDFGTFVKLIKPFEPSLK